MGPLAERLQPFDCRKVLIQGAGSSERLLGEGIEKMGVIEVERDGEEPA